MRGINLDEVFGKEIAYDFELTEAQMLRRNDKLTIWFHANQIEIEKNPYLYTSARLRAGAQIRIQDIQEALKNHNFIPTKLSTIPEEAEQNTAANQNVKDRANTGISSIIAKMRSRAGSFNFRENLMPKMPFSMGL